MSVLDRVREKYGNHGAGADRTDTSQSCGSSLTADLERRLRTMAIRWNYSDGELRELLDLARCDPITWAAAVALDERKFGPGVTTSKADA